MVKTVGSRFFFILLLTLSTRCIEAGVLLKVRDTDGNTIEQIAVGQPFRVEVVVDGLTGTPSLPTLEHDPLISCQRTGKRTSIINGRSTHTFTYQAQAEQPGRYIIGPATLSVGATH